MKAKLLILKKNTSQVSTKYGLKDKISFQLKSDKGTFWASCFKHPIADAWHEGTTQEMDLEQKEYNGKTFWNIILPKGGQNPQVMDALKRIEEKLDRLLRLSEEKIFDDVPEASDQEEPPPEDDNQIPY